MFLFEHPVSRTLLCDKPLNHLLALRPHNMIASVVDDLDLLLSEDAALTRTTALSKRTVHCVSHDSFDKKGPT